MSLAIPESPSARTNILRAELKKWETSFAACHDGRKPGREDIKANGVIAAKYKAYNRLRQGLPEVSSPIPRKRTRDALEERDGNARAMTSGPGIKTPRKDRTVTHASQLDPYDTPRSAQRSATATPYGHMRSQRLFVGPTPQKNGHILGLFDFLSPRKTLTPSKKVMPLTPSSKLRNAQQTPSNKRVAELQTPSGPRMDGEAARLPPTTLFATPTPSNTKPAIPSADVTPEYLRRHPLPTAAVASLVQSPSKAGAETWLDMDGLENIVWSPVRTKPSRKPIGRTLSQIAHSLRAMEDEVLDDELAILHEVEDEALSSSKPSDGIVKETQLGADGEHEPSDDDLEEIQDRTKRKYKKKGAKRSTKLVTMKPNLAKWKPDPRWALDEENPDLVQEKTNDGEDEKDQEKAKKKRMIKATANPNFKTLKIRNKMSKGGKANSGSRFHRRR